MPIRGLTDQVMPAFPRLGKLRKGGERTEADKASKRPGTDLHHFRFSSERPEVEEAFEEAYGTQPVLVNAYLPYARVEDNFQVWKEAWLQGGLQHRCDGVSCTIWLGADGKYQQTPKPCPGGCDEVGRLIVIIPELVKSGFVGYVTLETHGLNDLLSIQASLLAAAGARGSNPAGLRGIPWVIRRQPEKISTPAGNGKRVRREKWLVKLEPVSDWVQLQMETAHQAAMRNLAALPPPPSRVVDGVTGEIITSVAAGPTVEILPPEPPTDDFTSGEASTEVEVEENVASAPPPDPAPPAPPQAAILAGLQNEFTRLVQARGFDAALVRERFARLYACAPEAATVDQLQDAIDKLKTPPVAAPAARPAGPAVTHEAPAVGLGLKVHLTLRALVAQLHRYRADEQIARQRMEREMPGPERAKQKWYWDRVLAGRILAERELVDAALAEHLRTDACEVAPGVRVLSFADNRHQVVILSDLGPVLKV